MGPDVASSFDEHGIMGTSHPQSFRTWLSISSTHGMSEQAGGPSEQEPLISWFFCQAAEKFAFSTSATVSGRVGAGLEEKRDEGTTFLSRLSTTCKEASNILVNERKINQSYIYLLTSTVTRRHWVCGQFWSARSEATYCK